MEQATSIDDKVRRDYKFKIRMSKSRRNEALFCGILSPLWGYFSIDEYLQENYVGSAIFGFLAFGYGLLSYLTYRDSKKQASEAKDLGNANPT